MGGALWAQMPVCSNNTLNTNSRNNLQGKPQARSRAEAGIRELLTNYGKIDVLWYDVSWPLDAAGWESERMNKMVFELQPDIIVNNRNKLPGDFSTPEQQITAASAR